MDACGQRSCAFFPCNTLAKCAFRDSTGEVCRAQVGFGGLRQRCNARINPAAGDATAAVVGPVGDLSRAFAAAAAAASPLPPNSPGSSRPRRTALTSPAGARPAGGDATADKADAGSAKAGGGSLSGSVDPRSTPLSCAQALFGKQAGTGSAAAAAGESAAGPVGSPAPSETQSSAPPATGDSVSSDAGPTAGGSDAGGELSTDAGGADAALWSAVLWGRGPTAEVNQPLLLTNVAHLKLYNV
jgi:hypothetical protein